MLSSTQHEKFTQILISILSDLALIKTDISDDRVKDKYIHQIQHIYTYTKQENKFRHNYSDIFGLLSVLDKKEECNLEVLSIKLRELYDYSISKDNMSTKVIEGFGKLLDHVNLDVARIQYSKNIQNWTEQKLNELQTAVKKFEEEKETITKLKDSSTEIKEQTEILQKELKNSKVDYVTILGIFSSVVLAFIGGMTFSTSVLENIDKVSPYRLFSTLLIIGFVFFDIIWLLISFIIKLTDRKTKVMNYIGIGYNIIIIICLSLNLLAFKKNYFDSKNISPQILQTMTNNVVSTGVSNQNDASLNKENSDYESTVLSMETKNENKDTTSSDGTINSITIETPNEKTNSAESCNANPN